MVSTSGESVHGPSASIRLGLIPLVARLLMTAEFLIAAYSKAFGWSDQAAYMSAKGMSNIAVLLAIALVIEAVGSLCLIAGFMTRPAAAIMFVYLGIVSVRMHAFWTMSSNAAAMNQTEFFKNLGMMSGLLMFAVYGAGMWAHDARRAR
jgi:putative oxidoreductase